MLEFYSESEYVANSDTKFGWGLHRETGNNTYQLGLAWKRTGESSTRAAAPSFHSAGPEEEKFQFCAARATKQNAA